VRSSRNIRELLDPGPSPGSPMSRAGGPSGPMGQAVGVAELGGRLMPIRRRGLSSCAGRRPWHITRISTFRRTAVCHVIGASDRHPGIATPCLDRYLSLCLPPRPMPLVPLPHRAGHNWRTGRLGQSEAARPFSSIERPLYRASSSLVIGGGIPGRPRRCASSTSPSPRGRIDDDVREPGLERKRRRGHRGDLGAGGKRPRA